MEMNIEGFKTVDLSTIGSGEVSDSFQSAIDQVVNNIIDINTKAEDLRSIIIDIKFKPDKERTVIMCAVQTKTKLASHKPIGTYLVVDKNRKKPVMLEKQLSFEELE